MSDDPLDDPLIRLEIERLQRRAASYRERKRGRAYRSSEESLDDVLASPPLSREERTERDERNIGLELCFALLDENEGEAESLAQLVEDGEIGVEEVVQRVLTVETIDRFIEDYLGRLPPDDRVPLGDLDRARIVRQALAFVTSPGGLERL